MYVFEFLYIGLIYRIYTYLFWVTSWLRYKNNRVKWIYMLTHDEVMVAYTHKLYQKLIMVLLWYVLYIKYDRCSHNRCRFCLYLFVFYLAQHTKLHRTMQYRIETILLNDEQVLLQSSPLLLYKVKIPWKIHQSGTVLNR